MTNTVARKFILLFSLLLTISACGLLDLPIINRIVPPRGAPGQEIEIQGKNFGADQGTVEFTGEDGKTEVATFLAWSEKSVRLTVPLELTPGKYTINLIDALDDRSNNKSFIVVDLNAQPGSALIVANQADESLRVYTIGFAGESITSATAAARISLAQAGFDTRIRAIAEVPHANKFYVSVERISDTPEGNDSSELLVFTGGLNGVTEATRIDVGIQPSGLAVSPGGNRLYVAAKASGMLTVVDTETDLVVADLNADLSTASFGFSPQSVAVVASPHAWLGEHLVLVAGNNPFHGQAEIFSYAPGASSPAERITGHFPLADTTLEGAIAVSADTGKAWVTGQRTGLATIAMLDMFEGGVVEQIEFAPEGLQLPGSPGGVTIATDILAAPAAARLFVALPSVGVAEILMAQPGAGITESELRLIASPGASQLSPLHAPTGLLDSVLATKSQTGVVTRIPLAGAPVDFVTLEGGEITAVKQWSPVEVLSGSPALTR